MNIQDKLAGARSATAIDKDVTNGVGEMDIMGGSEHSQQGPKSETATAVDKEVTNEKKDTDSSDPSQTGHVDASEHSQKRTKIRDSSS